MLAPGAGCRVALGRLARANRRVVRPAMEARSTAWTAARAIGLSRWDADCGEPDDPPSRRDPSARTVPPRPTARGRERADVGADGSSRPSDETVAFRPVRVAAPNSVRYLAGVGVSAIPHTHPHVRLGRPSTPGRALPDLGFVAVSGILGPLAGLSLSCRGRMSPASSVHPLCCSATSRRLHSAPPPHARARLPLRQLLSRTATQASLSMLDRQTHELIMRFTALAGVANNACRANGRAPARQTRWRGSQPSRGQVVADRSATRAGLTKVERR